MNVGNESGGVQSLANITVHLLFPLTHHYWGTHRCLHFILCFATVLIGSYHGCFLSEFLYEISVFSEVHTTSALIVLGNWWGVGCRIFMRVWTSAQMLEVKMFLGCGHCNSRMMAVSLWRAAVTKAFMFMTWKLTNLSFALLPTRSFHPSSFFSFLTCMNHKIELGWRNIVLISYNWGWDRMMLMQSCLLMSLVTSSTQAAMTTFAR